MSQPELSARATLAPVFLVRFTTYSDRSAESVATVYRFSDRSILYDYGATGTVQQFEPFLVEFGHPAREFAEVAEQIAGASSSPLTVSQTLRLQNAVYPMGDPTADRLGKILRAENLENARVEIASVLLDPLNPPVSAHPGDLRSLTGDEHKVWFRGVVRRSRTTERAVTLYCENERARMAWNRLSNANADPRDVGALEPVIYGDVPRVRCLNEEVGWVTTLAEALTDSETGVKEFTDVSGMGATGTVKVGNEEIAYSAKSDANNTLTISARAQNSTTAVAHGRGEAALEVVATVKFLVADHPVKAINEVYLRNPASGELVRVPSGFTKPSMTPTARRESASPRRSCGRCWKNCSGMWSRVRATLAWCTSLRLGIFKQQRQRHSTIRRATPQLFG